MEFKSFKKQMQDAFQAMIAGQTHLFVTNVAGDAMWDAYLNSFTDPVEKQSHNCNCCKSFIRHYGNVVALVNGKVVTIWDFVTSDQYVPAQQALQTLVSSAPINNVFFTKFAKLGTDSNVALKIAGDAQSGTTTWNHLYFALPSNFVSNDSRSTESLQGTYRDNRNVFERSLKEITPQAIEVTLELISQNSLYRGQEFEGAIKEFQKYQRAYEQAPDKENYCWISAVQLPAGIAKIKNTAIGTLLTDISGGKELDIAVSAFERIMAPANYKRPTAIVTKAMVDAAEKEISELGLLEALGRRCAAPEDVSVNDLLWVNRDAKKASGVFAEMKEDTIVNPKTLSKVEEIGIDDFVEKVLPNINSMEVLFENQHMSNLVTMVTAEDKEAPTLFKWNNPFSWSYTNAVTDSIKEKVKAAGGNVVGEIRTSLSWHNHDDLDLHVREPNGHVISFRDKRSVTSGTLDVDMNAGGGTTRTPVENIIWTDRSKMKEGDYTVMVNQFSKRENKDCGYTIEIECQGQLYTFDFDKSPSGTDTVAVFTYTKVGGLVMKTQAKPSAPVSKEKWQIATNKFHKVSMVMNSPNYWSPKPVGNKHVFFVVEGAKTDETPRGFFNEFLKDDLVQNHKRVFEVLSGKLKVAPATKELSGLGFSSTQKSSVICKVEGQVKRTLKINF